MCDNFILNNNASVQRLENTETSPLVLNDEMLRRILRENTYEGSNKNELFFPPFFRRVSVHIQLAAREVLFHILGFLFQIRSNTKGGKATLILIFLLLIRLSVQTLSLFSLVFIHLIDDKIWNWSILSNVTKQSDQSVGVPSIFFSKSNSKICRRDLHSP